MMLHHSPWRIAPAPFHHARFEWQGGIFETARRVRTTSVEGVIGSPHHLVMVTLAGGARRHEFVTDDGFRFEGGDGVGSTSFLPAGCTRRLKIKDVAWEWASIALPRESDQPLELGGPFSDRNDPFLFGMLRQLRSLLDTDGSLEAAYCDTMVLALRQYLVRRSGFLVSEKPAALLTARQLRRVAEFVDANLGSDLRIGDLARLTGLSEGHFHRAFRAATGETPLRFIQKCRVQRAAQILAARHVGVLEVALEVGFKSASHFARTFREQMGVNPSRYLQDF